MDNKKISPELWEKVEIKASQTEKITRKSLTYWQDAWRRLKKNKLAMFGLAVVILIILFAMFGQHFTDWDYSSQTLKNANLPPKMDVYPVTEDKNVFVHREYTLFLVSDKGEIIERLEPTNGTLDIMQNKRRVYEVDGNEVVLDFSFIAAAILKDEVADKAFELKVNSELVETSESKWNKTYMLGTDDLGRDLFARVRYGATISLLIALVATLVQFFVGVFYGAISGYAGGSVDNVMMRIVDIISTIPLLLYVILLMVVIGPGLKTIMLALGLVYWVRMARIVRGEVLSLKEQEFVMAAKTLGASTWRIISRHLVPNALGPIIVSLAMMIPSAIFTEAFLSFIGLGVPAPMASWGTLANDAVQALRSYPHQLMWPSLAISMTVLSFNFFGDGLRNALDPKLRR
jgi:oligopeptide transport system permease protein